jgi:hypothetical protein
MIRIPKVSPASPMAGLTLKKSWGAEERTYYARYRDGAAKKLHSLGTSDPAEARAARDVLYAEFRAKGATELAKGRPVLHVCSGCGASITPWTFHHHGTCKACRKKS